MSSRLCIAVDSNSKIYGHTEVQRVPGLQFSGSEVLDRQYVATIKSLTNMQVDH